MLVDERPGHLWFPTLHHLGENGLLCIAAISADHSQETWPAVAYLSRDGGFGWRKISEISRYALSSVPIGATETLLLPYELAPDSPGKHRTARALGTRVMVGVHGMITAFPQEVQFDGFPRDLAVSPHGGLCMVTGGNVIELPDGIWFTTLYGRFVGDEHYSLLGMVSHDDGGDWSFRAQLATGKDIPNTSEGPSESTTVLFPNETLVCIYRVGSGASQDYHHSVSSDGGYHWTAPRALTGIGSVKPQGLRLTDGTLLLTGGRPGLTLWESRDDQTWRTFDLAAHHNATIGDPARTFDEHHPAATTSYTAFLQWDSQTALICYDRLGNGWHGAPGPLGATDAIYCLRVADATNRLSHGKVRRLPI